MNLEESITKLNEAITEYVKSSSVSNRMTQDAITNLAETVEKFAISAEIRMKILEQNMDALIKLITSQHSNGK